MFQLEQSHQHQLGEVLGQHTDQGQLNNVQGATLKKEKHQMTFKEAGQQPGENINPHHRIMRLEKNIAWLRDQHSSMVTALHKEIETFKNRNRELQFQLIMGKGLTGNSTPVAAPPLGTPEEVEPAPSSSGGSKSALPPILTNLGAVPPLQAEILDNEIKELQAALHEAKSRNIYLSSVVEQQKKRLASLEEELTVSQEREPTPQDTAKTVQDSFAQYSPTSATATNIPPDFLKKLSEAEDLVKKLQQQNRSQQEELDSIHSSLEREARMKYRGCNHPSKSFRHRHNSNNSSFDGSHRDLHPVLRTRNSSHDSQYVSASRLDISRTSDRFPPLKAMAVPRSRRQSNISRDVDSEVGGSDSSLNSHSTSLTTTLPRLSHYNSQPTIGGQSRSSKTGVAGGQGPGPRIVKTIIKRLPRDSGPRYGSLDRKHSRS